MITDSVLQKWRDYDFNVTALGEVDTARRMRDGMFTQKEQRALDHLVELQTAVTTAMFRVYAFFKDEVCHTFLQMEFIANVRNYSLWRDLERCAADLDARVIEMDSYTDDECEPIRHVEHLWQIDDYSVADAQALKQRITDRVGVMWSLAGNSVM